MKSGSWEIEVASRMMGETQMRFLVAIVATCFLCPSTSVCFADGEGSDVKYRLSYRKTEGRPWVFYADIRDRAKADKIAGELKSIGYQSRILVLSSATPTPDKAETVSTRPPPAPPVNLAPQPSVFGQGAASHFPSYYKPHRQPPTYRTPFYAPSLFWGWGGWGISFGAHPMINHVYSQNYANFHLNAPVQTGAAMTHPTPFPGHR